MLTDTLLRSELAQNADAALLLVDAAPDNDFDTLIASIETHLAVYDVVGAIRRAAQGFAAGDVLVQLSVLHIIKAIIEEGVPAEMRLASEIASAEVSEGTEVSEILAHFGHRAVNIMGQHKTVADLCSTNPLELMVYALRQKHAKWSNGFLNTRSPHPKELGAFPVAESLQRKPSFAEQMQQLGACSVLMNKCSEGLGQLHAALQMGLNTSLTHEYLAAAYDCLGDDSARDMHRQEEKNAAPDPNFVTVYHMYMDGVPEGVSADGRITVVNKRQQIYERCVSGKCFSSYKH